MTQPRLNVKCIRPSQLEHRTGNSQPQHIQSSLDFTALGVRNTSSVWEQLSLLVLRKKKGISSCRDKTGHLCSLGQANSNRDSHTFAKSLRILALERPGNERKDLLRGPGLLWSANPEEWVCCISTSHCEIRDPALSTKP